MASIVVSVRRVQIARQASAAEAARKTQYRGRCISDDSCGGRNPPS